MNIRPYGDGVQGGKVVGNFQFYYLDCNFEWMSSAMEVMVLKFSFVASLASI